MTDLVDIGFRARTEELQRATRELDKFEQATEEASAATDKLGRESDETRKVVNRTTQTTTQATARTRGLAEAKTQAAMAAQNYASRLGPIGGILSAIGPAGLAAAAAIGGIGVAMSRALDVAVQFDRINNTLRVATGSAQGAQSAFEFLSEESSRLGLNIQTAGLQFARLSAAARGTALEGRATRDVFSAVATAATALGLSADETGGALTAIEQMISKGTVSAEELRGQLGERLPGAFQLAARAIGVTTQELGKMLEQGQLTAEELLPKLARELNATFGPGAEQAANQYAAATQRVSTNIDLLLNAIGQDAQDAVTPALLSIAAGLNSVTAAYAGAKSVIQEIEDILASIPTEAESEFFSNAFDIGAEFLTVSGKIEQINRLLDFYKQRLRDVQQATTDAIPTQENLARFAAKVASDMEDVIPASTGAALAFDAITYATSETTAALREVDMMMQDIGESTSDAALEAIDFALEVDAATIRAQDLNDALEISNEVLRGTSSGMSETTAAAIEYWASLDRVAEGTTMVDGETRLLQEQLEALRSSGVEGYEAIIAQQERSAAETQLATQLVKEQGISIEEARIIAERRVAAEANVNAELARQRAQMRKQTTLADIVRGAAEEAGRAIQRSLGDAFRDVLDGNIKGFRDFFDSVVDIAKNAAAEIAAQFAFQNIVSFARGGGGIGLGSFLSSGAAAAGGGGGGGAGTLASVAGLFGSGGMGTGLSGAGLGSGFLGVGGLFQAGGAFGAGGGGLAQVLGLGSQVGIPGAPGSGFVTSGLGTAANFAGVAALGAGGGMLLADLLGNQSATGGAIGGGAGAALGFAVGGPLGALIGGALGGTVGAFLGGKEDKGSFALQTGGSGFTGGISQQSAFGTIGLGRGTADIGGDLAQTLLGAVAQADQLVASALTEQQIADVRNALQGSGQLVRAGRGNKYFEQAFGKAIADRFLTIFDALGIAAPSGLSALARADGTAGTATAGDVLGLALPALSQGLGLDNQTSSSIVDQLSGASGPSADLLGNIGTELVVGNQIQESNGRTLREIRNAIDSLTDEVRRGGSGALA
jgi:tape measure domain-containing protein